MRTSGPALRPLPLLLAFCSIVGPGCTTWVGPRIDLFDDGVEEVYGANVTLWDFGHAPKEDVYGFALSPLQPDVRAVTGVAAGLWVGAEELRGVQVGVLDMTGDDVVGVNVGGLLVQGERRLDGVNVGLVVGAGDDVRGISVAPIALTTYRWSDLEGDPDGEALGVHAAGVLLDVPHVTGIGVSSVLRARTLTGLGLGAVFTDVRDRLVGLSVGVVNRTTRLKGVQLGLLNRVAHRPWWCRWLPLINVGWDDAEGAPSAGDESPDV